MHWLQGGVLVQRAGFEPANPYGKGFLIGWLRSRAQTLRCFEFICQKVFPYRTLNITQIKREKNLLSTSYWWSKDI